MQVACRPAVRCRYFVRITGRNPASRALSLSIFSSLSYRWSLWLFIKSDTKIAAASCPCNCDRRARPFRRRTGQKSRPLLLLARSCCPYAEVLRKYFDNFSCPGTIFTLSSAVSCPYFLRSTSDPIRPWIIGLVSDLYRRRVGGGMWLGCIYCGNVLV